MKETDWTPQEKREYEFICDWQDNHYCNPTYADAIAWADTHPNWIKVEDRLPDNDGQLCVILTKTKSVLLSRWDTKTRVFSCLEKEIGYYKGGLLCWMPITLP